jgi:hypothetical protein
MTKAFALCGTLDEAMALDPEVTFLQVIRAPLIKGDEMEGDGRAAKNVDYKLRQLLSDALIADGITDVFKVAELQKPDISILSDQFLAEVSKIPQKNLAVELLQRLLRDEVQTRFKTNVVKQKRFSEMLQASLNKYANRSIEAAQVIEELIAMAKQFRDGAEKVEAMGLSIAEVAFYDALANNQSAHDLMGDEVLMKMARELATKLRGNLSIDWQYKENVRAKLRTMIKALLKRYKYPPDQEPAAIELVLQQTEMISQEWAREDLGDKIQAAIADAPPTDGPCSIRSTALTQETAKSGRMVSVREAVVIKSLLGMLFAALVFVQVPQWDNDWTKCSVSVPDTACHWYVVNPDNTFGKGFSWITAPQFDVAALNDIGAQHEVTVAKGYQTTVELMNADSNVKYGDDY